MTDRELLELAAKAAGHRIVEWTQDGNGVDVAIIIRGDGDGFSKRPWQPLLENQMTDAGGDALRLACALTITIQFPSDEHERPLRETLCWTSNYDPVIESHNSDIAAATCRAVVRAAAEIGRNT